MKIDNKKVLLIGLFLLITGIILNVIISFKIYDKYQKKIDDKIASIVGVIIENDKITPNKVLDITNNNYQNIGSKYLNENNIIILDLLENKKDLKKEIILYSTISILTMFILFVISFLYYQKRQNKKISEINKYMNNVLNGNYTLDIRDYKEGSLSILKNDIYKITIKLKEQTDLAVKEKQELESILSDISHQLKTPLTSMYVINDILTKDNLDKKKRIDFLNKNKLQLERIEWLVVSLLKLSRLDNGFIKLKEENINSKELINKALEPLLIPIELKKQKIVLDIVDTKLKIDIDWTVEALVNIIKNAHEHTNEEGTIKISVKDNPIYNEIIIEDNGMGIEPKDLPHIFERFYKGTHQKDSIGIGLNMAKKVIELQNGTIEVESKLNKYTIFKIKFYKNII